MFFRDDLCVYRTSGFKKIPWLEHGFGTSNSLPWPDSWRLATLRQVHSAIAGIARGPANRDTDGDALITEVPGLLVGVRTADCLPILLVDERRRVVAAVHAGWKGTLAEVAPKTVVRMQEEFGAEPARIHAAVGPGIGECCFEVGPEVAARFERLFPERRDLSGRARVDLSEANRRLLVRAGVPDEQIHRGAPCSCCLPSEFYSYRRNPSDQGRMLSVIGIRPSE